MNWEAIGAIGEILGALGVIGSVLYLAVQVRSDREATKANTTQMRTDGAREMWLTAATSEKLTPVLVQVVSSSGSLSPQMQAIKDQFGLDDEGATRLNFFWLAQARQMEGNYRQPMSDEERELIRKSMVTLVDGPWGSWWEHTKNGFASDFVANVEDWRKTI